MHSTKGFCVEADEVDWEDSPVVETNCKPVPRKYCVEDSGSAFRELAVKDHKAPFRQMERPTVRRKCNGAFKAVDSEVQSALAIQGIEFSGTRRCNAEGQHNGNVQNGLAHCAISHRER